MIMFNPDPNTPTPALHPSMPSRNLSETFRFHGGRNGQQRMSPPNRTFFYADPVTVCGVEANRGPTVLLG